MNNARQNNDTDQGRAHDNESNNNDPGNCNGANNNNNNNGSGSNNTLDPSGWVTVICAGWSPFSFTSTANSGSDKFSSVLSFA